MCTDDGVITSLFPAYENAEISFFRRIRWRRALAVPSATANTGPQASGNFVAGKPEGNGNFGLVQPDESRDPGRR